MVLHLVSLSKSSNNLHRIVAMQFLLLRALCAEDVLPDQIDVTWLKTIWKFQGEKWIEKFCRKQKFRVIDPIKSIAAAPIESRRSLFEEFQRQRKTDILFNCGGQFKQLDEIPNMDKPLMKAVQDLFGRFYEFLGHVTDKSWNGYEFSHGRCICKESYKNDLGQSNHGVCPYCDGPNIAPELDHYYPKSKFPFLSCSPLNLVPACHLCNQIGAKGDRIALTLNAQSPSADWLHPFFRPASSQTEIRLNGNPGDPKPQLSSPDADEQKRLSNHEGLIKNLGKHWRTILAHEFDLLKRRLNRRSGEHKELNDLVVTELEDQLAERGKSAWSLVKAALCQAILDQRPGYVEEFEQPNVLGFE